ncbi:ABC transporter ATP-binding protein [Rhodocaloribacter sp.]
MDAVVVKDIAKSFGAVRAVDGVSFSVKEGELFGFIGPDGAGKSTLFRMLVTLLLPDAGEAFVDGLHVVDDYRRLRPRLGYMPGRFSLYPDLSVEENLKFFATVFGTTIAQNYDLVKGIYAPLEPFRNRSAGKLSGGMKQKLALSCALIHRPRVLFLDEPTTGVDAVSRQEFWEMLERLKASGITIVVSTPYMDEARLCDRVALMQNGRLLSVDTPANIEATYDRPLFAVRGSDRYRLLKALRAYPHAFSVYAFGDSIHYTDARETADPEELRAYLRANGFADAEVEPIRAGIEDVFMALMRAQEAAEDAHH